MTIKLITFDLDNTLWHTDPVIIRAEQIQWQSILTHCPEAESYFTPDKLKQLKREIDQQHPKLRHKLSQFRIEFLFQLFIQCGINKTQAQVLAEQVFADFLAARNNVKLFPSALTVLEELQKHYQVIALSNGNSDLTTIGLDHLFQTHYHAENVSRPKPFDDMFLAALKYAGVKAEESVHIGDHPEQDVEAAQKIGFKTIWANILEHEWPASLSKADHEITHLDQLLDTLTQYR
jgi:HAD superfamily hydrolase (TIGR01509 family)